MLHGIKRASISHVTILTGRDEMPERFHRRFAGLSAAYKFTWIGSARTLSPDVDDLRRDAYLRLDNALRSRPAGV